MQGHKGRSQRQGPAVKGYVETSFKNILMDETQSKYNLVDSVLNLRFKSLDCADQKVVHMCP